jgi:hypothetical protein
MVDRSALLAHVAGVGVCVGIGVGIGIDASARLFK